MPVPSFFKANGITKDILQVSSRDTTKTVIYNPIQRYFSEFETQSAIVYISVATASCVVPDRSERDRTISIFCEITSIEAICYTVRSELISTKVRAVLSFR